MYLKYIYLLLISLTLLQNTYSINKDEQEFKEKYLTASYFYLYEDFEKALPYYLQLYDLQPQNANINFKIGYCYLQITGQKTKAIPFLEFAVKNINKKHNEFSYKETTAPEVAYYRLGEAYHINNEFDKAIEAYKSFKAYLSPKDIYNIDIVNKQIETCLNAKELYKYPVMVVRNNLGNLINSPYYDYNPVVSGDQNSLIYTSQRMLNQKELDSIKDYGLQIAEWVDEIYYSKKIDGKWTTARNISPELNANTYCSSVYLSENGTHLLIMKDDFFDGNIYESRLVDGVWSPIKKLNKNINSTAFEMHACLSKDGNTIYFSSDRKGGYGGFDIYRSTKNEKGEWGPAENLGATVNTKFDDDTPFILEDDRTLYFSSEGHYNIGGFDIFFTYLSPDNKWSTPLNLGYPINTSDDNLFLFPVNKGEFTYFSDAKSDNSPESDLYMMKLIVPENPGQFEIKGMIRDAQSLKKPRSLVTFNLFDAKTNTLINTFYSNIETGEYEHTTTPGDYKMIMTAEGYVEKTEMIIIPRILYRKEFYMNFDLMPDGLIVSQDVVADNKTPSVKEGYVAIKNISFENDALSPDFESKVEMERIIRLIETNPTLKVELAAYPSTSINPAYDIKVAERKQKAVLEYLKSNGISENQIQFKPVSAETELIALQQDIEIKVLKPENQILVADNSLFLPEKSSAMNLTYSVLVKKSNQKESDNTFKQHPSLNDIQLLETAQGDYLYLSGNFKDQFDALKHLNNVVDLGFSDATIMNNEEIENMLNLLQLQIIQTNRLLNLTISLSITRCQQTPQELFSLFKSEHIVNL
jgi:hypothetical protein